MIEQPSLADFNEILATLEMSKGWQAQMKYLISLGQGLPSYNPKYKTDNHLVNGCEVNVWLHLDAQHENAQIQLECDAKIVKGLLAVVVSIFNSLEAEVKFTPTAIINRWQQTGLARHLSPSRNNGIQAVINAISQLSQQGA